MNSRNLLQLISIPKLLFIIATLGFSLPGIGQTSIAVAPTKMNVFYIGVDNPVSVAASGAAEEKVTVSISGCEGLVSKTAAGLYNVRVSTVTDECMLNVYVDGKLAGATKFRVRNLPRPVGNVAGLPSGSKITADVFKKQAGVGVYVKDFPFEVNYEVIGFTVKMADNKGATISIDCQGALFSSQVKQSIEAYAKPGDIVTIQNIYVKDQGGKELKIPALLYSIE